ncbi:MAG: regulator of chromosome condensation 1/beta-lactamase-inhibitor protein II [Monoraphidium minutum]|nr:MAG: regulator of chromosome condensation 1/beta-lactamase-inhibitor protein II [Monoraphidium minutum]
MERGEAHMEHPKLPKLKARPAGAHLSSLEQEYAVSPNSPLLSTTVQNNAWVCGENGRGQLGVSGGQAVQVPQAIQAVGRWAAISVSDNHSAGLTCEGHIYTWGANNRGQLGHGDKCPGVIDAPVQVGALSDVDVKAVACGLEHTVAITAKDILSWGSNEYGQLGHGDHALQASDVCSRPMPVKVLHDVMVTQVVCGRFHTVCVTAQSQVFAWGHNSAGQLGLGDRRDRHSPTIIDALWALPVVQLAAGDAHSAALTSNGHMFIWGSNHFGQLGLVKDGDPLSSRSRKT